MTSENNGKQLVKTPTMFELAAQRADIIMRVIEAGGELTDEDNAALVAADLAIESKAEAYLAVMNRLEDVQARALEEAEIAANYAAACKRAIEAMRQRLTAAMQLAQVRSIKAANRTISVIAGRASVVVDDADKVPLDGRLARVEIRECVVTDKAAIKAAIEAGQDVPGARLVIGADTIRVTAPRAAKSKTPALDPHHDRAISSDINEGE